MEGADQAIRSAAGQAGESFSAAWSGQVQTADGGTRQLSGLERIGMTFAALAALEQAWSVAFGMIPFPAFPALRILDLDIGLPHAHGHPPNLSPPNPVPVPLPSTGPVIPIPLLSGANKTLINGMPAARCGDMGLAIWCGGWVPMFEVFLGSANVWIEGCRADRTLVDITNHCIFSMRPGDPPIGLFVGSTITGSANVAIGGVPLPSMLSLGMGAAFRGLGALAKKGASAFSRLASRAGGRVGNFLSSVSCFLKRSLAGAEPVNFVTGEVFVEHRDFSLDGCLGLDQVLRFPGRAKGRLWIWMVDTGRCALGI